MSKEGWDYSYTDAYTQCTTKPVHCQNCDQLTELSPDGWYRLVARVDGTKVHDFVCEKCHLEMKPRQRKRKQRNYVER